MRSRRQPKIYKGRYFPFSGGIPWKIESNKYVLPEIDSEFFNEAIDNKNIIVTAFGDYFESLLSLCILEGLNSIRPNHNIFWLGNSEYSNLAYYNGIGKISNIGLDKKILENYTTPLFFDKNNNVYFNALYNFIERKSYWNRYPRENKNPIIKQVFDNAMIPWSISYLPKMRKLGNDFIDELIRYNKIKDKSKIITLILNKPNDDILNWSIQQIKEFAQLVSTKGFKVIVFSYDISRFYGSKILAFEYDIRKILQIIKRSLLVISNDVRLLLSTLLISKAGIISVCKPNETKLDVFDVFSNAEFLNVENDIFSFNERITTMDAFSICEGL